MPSLATAGVMVIKADTNLAENHYGRIVIDASHVTLDCQGHTVYGVGDEAGVQVISLQDVTVMNCNVVGFFRGILVDRSENVTLSGNSAYNNDWGFWTSISRNVHFSNNEARENESAGFFFGTVSDSVIASNTSFDNSEGFSFNDSDSNQILDNNASSNLQAGVHIAWSHANRLENNRATGNDVGFFIHNSTEEVLIANDADENARFGFRIAEVGLIYLAANASSGEAGDEFSVEGRTTIVQLTDESGNSALEGGQSIPASEQNANWTAELVFGGFAFLVLLVVITTATMRRARQLILEGQPPAVGHIQAVIGQFKGRVQMAGASRDGARPSVKAVEDALRHTHDFAYLGSHELAKLRIVERRLDQPEHSTHIDRGRAALATLREAIEKFRPGVQRPAHDLSPVWHQYIILRESYIGDRLNREIMAELNISEGTFNRRRRAAIRALTTLLREWEELTTLGEVSKLN